MATNNAINSSNPIGVASGGTGKASVTAYAVLCGGTTSTGVFQSIAGVGTSGQVLTSNGASALPTFQAASGGITTLNGNSGSATGSTVTVTTGSGNAAGTAAFTGSSATVTLAFDDGSSNLGIGSSGLGNGATLTGSQNVCVGVGSGQYISSATDNCFLGYEAGRGQSGTHMTSSSNVGIGRLAVGGVETGSGNNTGVGDQAIGSVTTGAFNTALGALAASNYTGSESSNIQIGYNVGGTAAESHVLRVGNGTGNSTAGNLNKTIICGIQTIVVTGTAVLVSSSDQLGVAASSNRFKIDIQDMKDASNDIYKLRPVTFVWDKNSSPGLKDAPENRQPGLIAEEVYGVMPTMVVLDNDKKPLSVKYDLLIPLLLNEVQRLQSRVTALEAK